MFPSCRPHMAQPLALLARFISVIALMLCFVVPDA